MNRSAFIICTFFLSPVLSQQNAVASGGEGSGTGGQVSFTVGQIDYVNASTSGGTIYQGIQQPFELYIVTDGLTETTFCVSAYPNPAQQQLCIQINQTPDDMSFQLFSEDGKQINQGKITSNTTLIDMASISPGVYFVRILNGNQVTETIKVIKSNL